MELDELHVHQRDARAVRDGHAVAGRGITVRRLGVDAAEAAGGKDRRLGGDQFQLARAHVVRRHAGADAVFDGQRRGKVLFVDLDPETFELLPQGVQDDQARHVGGVARARRAGAAEGPLRDASVGQAREDAAAVLEPDDLARRVVGHRFDRVLVAQVVRTLDAVERVVGRGVFLAVTQGRVDAALRCAGVAAHGMHLGDDRDVGSALGGFDRRTHTG